MGRLHGIALPVNVAYQHPYYLGHGAAAITKSEGHFYLSASYDRMELEDDLIRLAVAAHDDHQKHSWKYYFDIIRIYTKIDVDKAKPVLEDAIGRLTKQGVKLANLDDLLREPPQSHSKQ